MINAFQEIISYNKNGFEDYLKRISLLDIFSPVFKEYEDRELCTKIIKYIAYAYTFGSPKIFIGTDRRKEKTKIFRELSIPQDYYDAVVILENRSIVDSVTAWLKFGDNLQIEYLMTLKDAYVQHQKAALENIKKSTGEIDFDQKMRCVEYMEKLKVMIRDAENNLQQNDPKFKETYSEVQKARGNGTTMGLETFLKD